jgi:hypothetical protein
MTELMDAAELPPRRSDKNQTGTKRWLFRWLALRSGGKNSNESWWWMQYRQAASAIRILSQTCVGCASTSPSFSKTTLA